MTVHSEPTITCVTSALSPTYQIGPEWVSVKVSGALSGGAYLVIEVTTPAGGGPPLHTHPAAEVFFVTEGRFEFPTLLDGQPQSVSASAGEVVHIPGGVPHTYKNIGESYGRLMGVLMPASEMEGFFEEAGIPVTDRDTLPTLNDQPDIERLFAAAAKYHLDFSIVTEA